MIHKTDDGHVPPWEYLYASDFTPYAGLALIQEDGLLGVAGSTDKPQYICMRESDRDANGDVPLDFGDLVPVIRVTPDIIFETTNAVDYTETIIPGDKVTICDGLQVTATKTGGVATVVDFDGTAPGSKIRVTF